MDVGTQEGMLPASVYELKVCEKGTTYVRNKDTPCSNNAHIHLRGSFFVLLHAGLFKHTPS